jgi:hypothetical protein
MMLHLLKQNINAVTKDTSAQLDTSKEVRLEVAARKLLFSTFRTEDKYHNIKRLINSFETLKNLQHIEHNYNVSKLHSQRN